MRFIIICIIGTTLFINSGFAQDSTFNITFAEELIPPLKVYSFVTFKSADLDWDGKLEIIYSANLLINRNETAHAICIVENGQQIFQSEFRPNWLRTKFLMVADLDGDNTRDIAVEAHPFRTFEIFSGPEFELSFTREYSFDGRYKVSDGDVWLNEDGEYEPVFAHHILQETGGGGNWSRSYGQSRILTGSPVDGYPDQLALISDPISFVLKEREDHSGTDYFVAGRTNYHYHIHDDDGFREEEYEFRMLNTSYNRELQTPDSLLLYSWDETKFTAEDSSVGFIWSSHAVVEDLDNDGDLEWVVSWFDIRSEDTSYTHVQLFNPEDLTLQDELVIRTRGLPSLGYIPTLCRGVKAVDIDRDGDWELLVYIAGEPLMVVDPENMEVIMRSEQIMPEYMYKCFTYEIGYFTGDDENLQILVQSGLDEASIYNLPEDWTNYYEVKDRPVQIVYEYRLLAAYPNPFNSITTIRYGLPNPSNVSLQVYNLAGQQITTLFEGYRQAGMYSTDLTANDLPSGLYFVRLKASDQVFTQKVMLIR